MVYHKVMLGPSDGQLLDLTSGEQVKLAAKNLKGNVSFIVTTAQLKKIQAAASAGRGCLLRFSPQQIKHLAQSGEGIVKDLAMKAYAMLKPAIRSGVRAALALGRAELGTKVNAFVPAGFLRDRANQALDYGKDQIESRLGLRGGSLLGSIVRGVGGVAVDRAARMVGGKLKFSDPIMQYPQGKGIISDTLGSFGLGVQPNPLATANEGLSAALRQKKVPVGRGLYAPGGQGLYGPGVRLY